MPAKAVIGNLSEIAGYSRLYSHAAGERVIVWIFALALAAVHCSTSCALLAFCGAASCSVFYTYLGQPSVATGMFFWRWLAPFDITLFRWPAVSLSHRLGQHPKQGGGLNGGCPEKLLKYQ